MTEKIEAKNLAACAEIRHGFFTRAGGVSEGVYASLNCGFLTKDDPAKIAENRARVAAELGAAPEKLLSCRQIHGADVLRVEEGWGPENMPAADAMVTKRAGFALGILTADCVPVLFADPAAGVIAAAHAGWKSAIGGVLENTVAAMETLGASRENILAAIGPCIWQDSYEVDLAFMDRFLDQDELNNRFFFDSDKPDHFLFELPGYVRDRLRKAGLSDISLSPADTCADEERFFSYRRSCQKGEAEGGRQISAVMLAG
jgi:YfiH family protein